ncbi:MAG: hypothetical protein WA628_04960, partial [Terriglobales bacterium]
LSDELGRYQAGHRSLARRPALMSKLMLLLEHREGLRQRVMRAFLSEPKLVARVLATHVGAVPPLQVASNGLALGLRLHTALTCFLGLGKLS